MRSWVRINEADKLLLTPCVGVEVMGLAPEADVVSLAEDGGTA
jgi:hypothetical protein